MNQLIVRAIGFQPSYIREITNALARTGWKVFLLAGSQHRRGPYPATVTFVDVEGDEASGRTWLQKGVRLCTRYTRTVTALRRIGVRLVYDAGIGRPFLSGVILYSLLKVMGFRIVHTVHNVLPHSHSGYFTRLIHCIIYRHLSDLLLVHARCLGERLRNEFRVRPGKIVHVEHGTYSLWDNPLLTRAAARQSLGLHPDILTLLVFGLQRPYKGTHLLLQMLDRNRCATLRLLIRGSGEEKYVHRLLDLIAQKQLDEVVDFRPGYVPDEEVEVLFKTADAVVLPYTEENSQSGVLFMAYAYGIPVLASNLGCFREYIVPGRTGELFQPGDWRSFQAALDLLRLNRASYDHQFIHSWACSRFSWDNTAREILHQIERRDLCHER